MMGDDGCRCPGCGTCDAAQEIDELRCKLKDAQAEATSWRATARDKGYSSRVVAAERDKAQAAVIDAALIHAQLMKERDDVSKDYASLECDAARVVLAYLHGDSVELDEAVSALMSNGRDKWWEKHQPIGLRGEVDDSV